MTDADQIRRLSDQAVREGILAAVKMIRTAAWTCQELGIEEPPYFELANQIEQVTRKTPCPTQTH
jgi:hypothetical protein